MLMYGRNQYCKAIILQLKIKKQLNITSHQSEQPSLKSLQIINAGEGEEKREPSYTPCGNANWWSHYGKQYRGSFKKQK